MMGINEKSDVLDCLQQFPHLWMRKRWFEVTSEGELEPQKNSFPVAVPLPCPSL
jgi:hypothetical protein